MEHNGIARSPELGQENIINVDEVKTQLQHGRLQNAIETPSVYVSLEKIKEDLKKLQQRVEQKERMLQSVRHPDCCTVKDGTICKHLPDDVAGEVNKDLVDEKLKEDWKDLEHRIEQLARMLDYSIEKVGTTRKYLPSDVAGMVNKDLVEKLNSGRHYPELEAKLDELMTIFCMHKAPFEDFEKANFKEYTTKTVLLNESLAYVRNGRHLFYRNMTISACFFAIQGAIFIAYWAGFAEMHSWSPCWFLSILASLVTISLMLWNGLKLDQHHQSEPACLSAGFSFNLQLPPSLKDHPEGRKYMEEAFKTLEMPGGGSTNSKALTFIKWR